MCVIKTFNREIKICSNSMNIARTLPEICLRPVEKARILRTGARILVTEKMIFAIGVKMSKTGARISETEKMILKIGRITMTRASGTTAQELAPARAKAVHIEPAAKGQEAAVEGKGS